MPGLPIISKLPATLLSIFGATLLLKRAKIVFERLIGFTRDKGSKEALQFLMTREITHMRAFTAALDSIEKPQFSVGIIEPTPGLVDQLFNGSTGESQYGETDFKGPWNSGTELHYCPVRD